MVRQIQRRTSKKRKIQKKFSRNDDEDDFVPQLIGGLLTYAGGRQAKPQGYNIGDVSQMQDWESRIGDYGAAAQEGLGLSRAYMDPSSMQNRLMRSGLIGQSMDMIGLQNQLNARNPNVTSGILGAQNRATTQQGISGALGQYGQGLLSNINMGMGAFNQGVGNLGNVANQYGNLAQNYAQQHIANQQMRNQWRGGVGGLLGQFGMGMMGGGQV